MATKIIHILKNDKFEDILEEFKNSEAEEVIFIFPNNSKFGQNEAHFQALDHEAQKAGKTVTILALNDQVKNYAQKYNFQFIQSPQGEGSKSKITIVPAVDEEDKELDEEEELPPEKNPEENIESIEEEDTGHELMAELAVAKKKIADVVSHEDEKEIHIKTTRGKNSPIEIRSYNKKTDDDNEKRIEKMWFGNSKKTSHSPKGPKEISKKWLFIFMSISVAVLLLIIYSALGSAQIIIKPQTQQLDFQIKASASSKNSSVDSSFGSIPGEYFVLEETDTKTVPASGQKEVVQKAKGTIIVYNKQSATQTLVATTRFENPQGLIYRISKSISIPANGQLEIEVIADQPGEKYNIDLTDFTIPGLKGTQKFDKVTAESKTPMSGGFVGLANVATEGDLDRAKSELKQKLFEKINEKLKTKTANLITVESVEPVITSENISNKAGEATKEIKITMIAKLSTVAFSGKDIFKLIDNFVQKTGDLTPLQESLTIQYKDPQIDEKEEKLKFIILVKGKAGAKIDENQIIEKLAGLQEEEIKDIVKAIKEIETVRIILSPFWVNRIPNDKDKIKLKIQYE